MQKMCIRDRADAQESEVRTFIKEIRRYATIEELDESVLNRLISKILIGEVKKVDGQKAVSYTHLFSVIIFIIARFHKRGNMRISSVFPTFWTYGKDVYKRQQPACPRD